MSVNAVADTFGDDIDFAQPVKIYGIPRDKFGRAIGNSEVVGTIDKIITGDPDVSKINTSYVERQNLRMGMRHFTRRTNGRSKKVENHAAAIANHFVYINFGRSMKALANPYPRAPAMASGLADHVWSLEEIAALLN